MYNKYTYIYININIDMSIYMYIICPLVFMCLSSLLYTLDHELPKG